MLVEFQSNRGSARSRRVWPDWFEEHRGPQTADWSSPLIPAHDEQDRIGKAIRSLDEQFSKPDLTIVIADGCTDRTALAAQSAGADVFVTVGNEHKRAGALNQRPRPSPPTAPRR